MKGNKEVTLLQKRIRELSMIETISKIDKLSIDWEELFIMLLAPVVQEVNAEFGVILLYNNQENKLSISEVYGIDCDEVLGQSFNADEFIMSMSFSSKEHLIINQIDKHPQYSQKFECLNVEKLCHKKITSLICCPIEASGEIYGGIEIMNKKDGRQFDNDDIRFLNIITGQLAVIIQERNYLKEIVEKTKREANLARYFSPEVYNEIIKNGAISELKGKLDDVTVLFADIRNFTSYTEILPPYDVINLLNTCFEKVTNIIFQYGGTLDKFIGDAVFVTWGTPIKHKNDAVLAVLSAVVIHKELGILREAGKLPQDFGVGIGITCGQSIVGNVGSKQRLEYTTIGDSVNVASRFCDLAGKEEILISKEIYQKIENVVEATYTGEKNLKGKSQLIEVYKINNLKEDISTIYSQSF